MTSEISPDTVSISMTVEDDTPGVVTSDKEGSVPEGATYPSTPRSLLLVY